MPLALKNPTVAEIQTYLLIRAYQNAIQGGTCELSVRKIAEQAERFGARPLSPTKVHRGVHLLVEGGFLVRFRGGLRCTYPHGDGTKRELRDAFYGCPDRIGYRTTYAFPSALSTGFPQFEAGCSAGETDCSVGEGGSGELFHGRNATVPSAERDCSASGTPDALCTRAQYPLLYPLVIPTPPPNVNANLEGTALAKNADGLRRYPPDPPIPARTGGVEEGAESNRRRAAEEFKGALIRELIRRGVTRSNPQAPWDAERLVGSFPLERVALQVRHFDYLAGQGRQPRTGGWLVRAIVADLSVPAAVRAGVRPIYAAAPNPAAGQLSRDGPPQGHRPPIRPP